MRAKATKVEHSRLRVAFAPNPMPPSPATNLTPFRMADELSALNWPRPYPKKQTLAVRVTMVEGFVRSNVTLTNTTPDQCLFASPREKRENDRENDRETLVQRVRRRFVTGAGLSTATCTPFVPS
jgi:hypothetical protein